MDTKETGFTIFDYLNSICCDDVMIYELEEIGKVARKYCKINNVEILGVKNYGFGDLYIYPEETVREIFGIYFPSDGVMDKWWIE